MIEKVETMDHNNPETDNPPTITETHHPRYGHVS